MGAALPLLQRGREALCPAVETAGNLNEVGLRPLPTSAGGFANALPAVSTAGHKALYPPEMRFIIPP
jgi:hypothetical protein